MTPPKPPPGEPGDASSKGLRADARRNRARILAAAEAVFAEKGTSAATEEVAARAGVAIGTVFRHFPTKQALLQAIMKDLLMRLTQQLRSLAANADPATALFTFITLMVEQATEKKTVVELLAETGITVQVADAMQALRAGVEELLSRSQQVGAVREDVRLDEVIALLTGACQGALHAGWDQDLRQRTLAIVFNGLRPPAAGLLGDASARLADHTSITPKE
jgi:AcrR family transcriptional regulator